MGISNEPRKTLKQADTPTPVGTAQPATIPIDASAWVAYLSLSNGEIAILEGFGMDEDWHAWFISRNHPSGDSLRKAIANPLPGDWSGQYNERGQGEDQE